MEGCTQELPATHPLRLAFARYKSTADYANSFKWAGHEEHRDGSLWAAFMSGWTAGEHHERYNSCGDH